MQINDRIILTNTTGNTDLGPDSVIELLFRTYFAPLCKFVNKMVHDQALAEDIIQETFIRIWNSRENLDTTKSIKSYLYKIAYNYTLNHLEKQKNFTMHDYSEVDKKYQSAHADEQIINHELQYKAAEALNSLPVKCRAVFIMCRHENMTYQEVADAMEISVKTVENQMGKALKSLRQQLSPYFEVISLILFLN